MLTPFTENETTVLEPTPETLTQHLSGDILLGALSSTDGLIGEIVRAYPGEKGASVNPRWLEEWFQQKTETVYGGLKISDLTHVSEESTDKLLTGLNPKTPGVKLLSIEPHYFRGFRSLPSPVLISPGLTVIDGKNSSGKTSLAEALEWLLTGDLVRRSLKELGNSRELENCIGNQFRPENEGTWVEAILSVPNRNDMILRRVLVEDYGPTSTKGCTSNLLKDGVLLSRDEEATLLDELLADSPPLLMQHTLRLFVYSAPTERRQYFERLLRLDELTTLIEKAVIGPSRLVEFPRATESSGLKHWNDLKKQLKTPRANALAKRVDKIELEKINEDLEIALVGIAHEEFGILVAADSNLEIAQEAIEDAQKIVRQRSLPILDTLRPKRVVDDTFLIQFNSKEVRSLWSSVITTVADYRNAKEASVDISAAQIAIAKALSLLADNGLIDTDNNDSDLICPLCDYSDLKTLTGPRLAQIQSWTPAQKALQVATGRLENAISNLYTCLQSTLDARHQAIAALPDTLVWEAALENIPIPIADAAKHFRIKADNIAKEVRPFDDGLIKICTTLKDAKSNGNITNDFEDTTSSLLESLYKDFDVVIDQAREYADAINSLEETVGSQAKEDPEYKRRNIWILASTNTKSIVSDICWERAKVEVQDALAKTREALIAIRKDVLEHRRVDFSDGMTKIWKVLRADRYSTFSQLTIPTPRGKGFPVEIGVKAQLDNSISTQEVDALRVFSESQIHVLGIAAFITRCSMLGHRFLVLDDPVQSMDEEHFYTFANKLIPLLLNEGLQLVIFTHNETFARDVSTANFEHVEYATIEIRHSRKKGCQIERDNRRTSERLRRAEKMADDGDLSEAWKVIRLAIERLYLIAYLKHGPSTFKPAAWVNSTAEDMFTYVGPIITGHDPTAGPRLKDILRMTAAGAHDKPARGFTDAIQAIQDVKSIVTKLGIVD